MDSWSSVEDRAILEKVVKDCEDKKRRYIHEISRDPDNPQESCYFQILKTSTNIFVIFVYTSVVEFQTIELHTWDFIASKLRLLREVDTTDAYEFYDEVDGIMDDIKKEFEWL